MLGEGINLSEQTKDMTSLAHFLDALATSVFSRGEAERLAVLLGAAEGSLREVGAPVQNYFPKLSLWDRPVGEVRAVLGDTAFEEARGRGQAMVFEQVVAYTLEDDEASTNLAASENGPEEESRRASRGPDTLLAKTQKTTHHLPTPSHGALASNRGALPIHFPATKSAPLAGCSKLAPALAPRPLWIPEFFLQIRRK